MEAIYIEFVILFVSTNHMMSDSILKIDDHATPKNYTRSCPFRHSAALSRIAFSGFP
jgi:hypothetical protein